MAKILIIEDTEEVRELLDVSLSDKGFTVLQAEGGQKGIESARQCKPDLVLLDAMMPDSNGIEVLKKIREFDKDVKIIMLSGLDSEELEEEARDAGASGFLSKSQGIEAIVKTVSEALC